MVLIVSLIFTAFIALYFGLYRLIDHIDYKKKELLQFLMVYSVLLAVMACLSFIFTKENTGEYWHLNFNPIRDQVFIALFYIPPTFGVAYLLYPFKIIKRNWILLWVLLIYALFEVGLALLTFLVSISNM